MKQTIFKFFIIIFITIIYLGIGCTQVEGKVEISVDDYNYNSYAKLLTLYIVAESTGEVGVKDVSCTVHLIIDGSTHDTENISFSGSIDPGDSKTKTVLFSNVVANYSWSVEFSDIEVEVDVSGPGCSNITS